MEVLSYPGQVAGSLPLRPSRGSPPFALGRTPHYITLTATGTAVPGDYRIYLPLISRGWP